MPASDKPTMEEVDRLVARLEPEISRRFRERGVSPEEAAERLDSALVELVFRWNRVGDRERWLLGKLDPDAAPGAASNPGRPKPPGKEPED